MIPVGVGISFINDLKAVLRIGFIRITVYPSKPKKPKPKKKKKKPEEPKKEEKKEKKPNIVKEKGLSWLVDTTKNAAILAKGVLRDFFKHLIIKRLQISVTYCGENADDTAVKYGYLCLSVYPAVSPRQRSGRKPRSALWPDIAGNLLFRKPGTACSPQRKTIRKRRHKVKQPSLQLSVPFFTRL